LIKIDKANNQQNHSDGKRYLGITPGELLCDGFKKGGKAKENDTCDIEAEKRAGQNDSPSVKNSFHHWICILDVSVLMVVESNSLIVDLFAKPVFL
jgi:hypothetical protein